MFEPFEKTDFSIQFASIPDVGNALEITLSRVEKIEGERGREPGV
jgi:hypothetical protein